MIAAGLEMSEKSQKGDGPAVDEVQLDDKTPAAAVASTPLTTPSTTPLTTPSTTPSTVKSAAGGRRTRPNGGGGGSGGVSRFKDKNKRSASKTPQRASVPAHTASAGVVQLASDQVSQGRPVGATGSVGPSRRRPAAQPMEPWAYSRTQFQLIEIVSILIISRFRMCSVVLVFS